ncbi:hypothetical protein [Streptomyces sp. NPDC001876]|uniref:hypothetical protein n=1 Tax=Streptomyces sp. NPDC001876 TaxID=3154402 RepID=UPI00332B0AE5
MSERRRNRAIVLTEATAEATQDSAGNPTVTVKGVFKVDNFVSIENLHLSTDAAYALLFALDEAL